jgi:hypothetical protein
MLATSTAEVRFPGGVDLIFVLPNKPEGGREPTRGQTIILCQLNHRGEPGLRLASRVLNVDYAAVVLPVRRKRTDNRGLEEQSGSWYQHDGHPRRSVGPDVVVAGFSIRDGDVLAYVLLLPRSQRMRNHSAH